MSLTISLIDSHFYLKLCIFYDKKNKNKQFLILNFDGQTHHTATQTCKNRLIFQNLKENNN